MDRATPYHVPHSTQVAGYAVIWGADDRWIGNVFARRGRAAAYGAGRAAPATAPGYGTAGYDGHPSSFDGLPRAGRRPAAGRPRPVPRRRSSRSTCATTSSPRARRPYAGEDGAARARRRRQLRRRRRRRRVLPRDRPARRVRRAPGRLVTGADLPRVRFVDADFEERDGTPVRLTKDLLGATKVPDENYAAGPIGDLTSGRRRLW